MPRLAASLGLLLVVLLPLQGTLQPLHVLTHHTDTHAGCGHACHAHAHHQHAHACGTQADHAHGDDEPQEHDEDDCSTCLAIAFARHVTVDTGGEVVLVSEPLVEHIAEAGPRPASRTQRGPLGARAPPAHA